MKVLIIGLGSIARKHITALRKIDPSAEIYALRSSRNSKDEEGVQNIYELDEAKNLNLSFVIISSPTYMHEQNLRDLKNFNIPLFIEKPVSHNLNVVNMAGEFDHVLTYIACNMRFLDCLQHFKHEYIDKGLRINDVRVYAGSYLPNWRPVDYKTNYSASAEQGGGVHLDLIHEIDYVYWYFGVPSNKMSYLKSASSIDVDSIDYANYVLDYDQFCVSIQLNYFRMIPQRYIEVITDKSIYYVDLLKNEIFENGISIYKSEQQIIETYEVQLRYFTSLLSGEKTCFNTLQNGIEVLKICL